MKKVLLLMGVLFIANFSYAQDSEIEKGIEKSITGVQIGILGASVYNEYKLTEKIALRSDVGLFLSGFATGKNIASEYTLVPYIGLQPKYYFNIESRAKKGRNIKNNGANYFSIQLDFLPDLFVISNKKNTKVQNQIHMIPTFGIRRNFAENFNYEFKAGYGLAYGFDDGTISGMPNLSFKVGYDL